MIFAVAQLLWMFGPAIFGLLAIIIIVSVCWHVGSALVQHARAARAARRASEKP